MGVHWVYAHGDSTVMTSPELVLSCCHVACDSRYVGRCSILTYRYIQPLFVQVLPGPCSLGVKISAAKTRCMHVISSLASLSCDMDAPLGARASSLPMRPHARKSCAAIAAIYAKHETPQARGACPVGGTAKLTEENLQRRGSPLLGLFHNTSLLLKVRCRTHC